MRGGVNVNILCAYRLSQKISKDIDACIRWLYSCVMSADKCLFFHTNLGIFHEMYAKICIG